MKACEINWAELDRWIKDELCEDEEERARYIERRALFGKIRQEDAQMEERINTAEERAQKEVQNNTRRKPMNFMVEEELRLKIREYCAEHEVPIGEFCRNAIESALEMRTFWDGRAAREAEALPEAPMEPPTRGVILDIAREIVCADREETYGSAEDNFAIIAELWGTYLFGRGIDNGDTLAAEDVAAMMILLKVARIATGRPKTDNWVDVAGYAACGGECQGAADD